VSILVDFEGDSMSEEKKVEEKGFVIRDKRQFTTEGEAKSEAGAPKGTATSEAAEKAEAAKEKSQESKGMPLPEINFATFVLSISSSVLLHFGDVPDPISGKKERNLPMAKQTIDILGILKEKTKGNLDKEEEQLLENLLHDLRLKYVQECKKG
jgi:hypothetical protein